MSFDLGIYSKAAQKEGFCLLHTAKKQRQTLIFEEPERQSKTLPQNLQKDKIIVGHLSYPNPNLENEIPESNFYQFKTSKIHTHKANEKLYSKIGKYRTKGRIMQSVTKKEYVKKIDKIKRHLTDGEIYQLNYAIRFQKQFEGEAYVLFLKWLQKSKGSFSAFINCGSYQILSNSPERLFKVKKNKIITEPIKGTAKKIDKKNSPIQTKKLLSNEKEKAELDMITDLARNDVGQICEFGTLKIEKHRELMELPNLWHTHSRISGRLSKKTQLNQVIQAMFPGGSVTGCPKKRAMQCIEELEENPRNIFTGSIAYLKTSKQYELGFEADFSIAIRTALVQNGMIEYWAGGGITMDSDPEKEYEECLLKAESFLELL